MVSPFSIRPELASGPSDWGAQLTCASLPALHLRSPEITPAQHERAFHFTGWVLVGSGEQRCLGRGTLAAFNATVQSSGEVSAIEVAQRNRC